MTQATKHTPTPWFWTTDNSGPEDEHGCKTRGPIDVATFNPAGYGNNPELIGADGEIVISAGSGEYTPYTGPDELTRKANAAFIVTACNAHDELVAALTEAHSHLCNGEFKYSPFVTALRLKVAAALAKVQP